MPSLDLLTRPAACAEVMNALEACHARGFLWKSLGMCTDAKDAVSQCMRAERAKRQIANQGDAKGKREKIQKLWAEIEENS